jgi:quinol monooxygenase YgiN
MIVRIVKMTFRPENVNDFLKLFHNSENKIRHFAGCSFMELLQDTNKKNSFFTLSHWESENHLNQYRDSELFKTIWTATKTFFANKPEAWSLIGSP